MIYAQSLFMDDGATCEDLREALTTLEEMAPTARRVLGGTHPTTRWVEAALETSRAALRVRETPPPGPSVERTFARGWLDGPG